MSTGRERDLLRDDDGDRFVMAPSGTVMTQCLYCRHAADGTFARACPDFPGGIPDDITANEFDHRREHPDESPMEGVTPVRFEPRDDVPPVVLESLYRELDGLHDEA